MPRKRNNAHKAEIVQVAGGSGSGKTTWMKKKARPRSRVAVYDAAKHEYGDLCSVIARTERDLLQALRQNLDDNLKVAFQPVRPTPESFDFWCRAVYAWGNATVIAEELADVTSPGKAPPGWGDVIRKGRAYGLKVYGLTQRPAESDKTLIGNATLIHCGRLSRSKDRKYMADEMSLKPDDLIMRPLEWVEYDLQNLKHKRGKG